MDLPLLLYCVLSSCINNPENIFLYLYTVDIISFLVILIYSLCLLIQRLFLSSVIHKLYPFVIIQRLFLSVLKQILFLSVLKQILFLSVLKQRLILSVLKQILFLSVLKQRLFLWNTVVISVCSGNIDIIYFGSNK